LTCTEAAAEKRVALVMGNSAYKNVGALTNPANDSEAMSATLKDAGFDVVDLRKNLGVEDMRRALRDFAANARGADVAIVFFAGHGIEVGGINYVIPVDAVLEHDIDVDDEAISLDRILTIIEPAKQLRLVILDACRENPFSKTMKRTIGSRAIDRGLAKVEPNPNTLVAFAAKAGSAALDGDGQNSPFTSALIKHIATPGLDLRKAFGYVRDEVLKNTGNKQEPYVYGSLGGDDVPLVPAEPAATAPAANPQADIRRDYELSLQLGTREAWSAFLVQHPDGFYASLAKGQLNKIAAEEARVAATEKARLAAEEQKRLSAEGAKKTEQAKAAADARLAEEAQLAAEKNKSLEDAKVAQGERIKLAAQAEADAKAATAKKVQVEANEEHAELAPDKPEQAAQDDRAYAQAQGNVELLKGYLQKCRTCSHKTSALQEVTKLDNEAQFFMLKVCNRSSRKASVAVMGRTTPDNDDWHIQGWWSIPSGQCNNVKRYVRGMIYLFAQEDGNPSFAWKGSALKLCVAVPGPFDRINRDGYACQSAEKTVAFSSFSVSDSSFTWDLNASN